MTLCSRKSAVHIVLAEGDFDGVRDGDVLPLRPDLYLEACRRYGAERVKDAGEVIRPRDLLRCRCRVERQVAGLLRCVQEDRSQPWLEGAGIFMLQTPLFALSFALLLYKSLLTKYDEITISVGDKKDELRNPAIHRSLWMGLHTGAAQLRARGARVRTVIPSPDGSVLDVSPRPPSKVVFAAKHGLGWVCNRYFVKVGGVLKTRGRSDAADPAPAEVLLAGVQLTDVARQGPLAARLEKRFGDRFLWLQGDPDKNLEGGEKRMLDLSKKAVTRRLASDAFSRQIWRWWRLKTWSMVDVAWQMATILRNKVNPPVDVDQKFLVQLVIDTCHAEAVLLWRRWCRTLDRLRPRVIVGNSNLFDMAFIAAWAQRRGCPFIMLPHGFRVEPVNLLTVAGADVVVEFGPEWNTILKRNKLYRPPAQCINAGPLFLKDDGQTQGGVLPHRSNRALYLESHFIDFPADVSPKQNIDLLYALCRAIASAGMELTLRRHPRIDTGDFYEQVAQYARTQGAAADVDQEKDLVLSARRGKCAVVRTLDTAAVTCLISGCPLVAYLPHRTWPPGDRFLARVALTVRTEDQLARCLTRIARDETYGRSLVKEQMCALQPFVDVSKADSWDSVVERVECIVRGNALP